MTARPADPGVVRLALSLLLHARHEGRARAATWETLRAELAAEGLHVHVRRLQEGAEQLVSQGVPVVALSAVGVWLAETAEEIEEALLESERRARATLRRRRLLRRAHRELLGQERLRASGESA